MISGVLKSLLLFVAVMSSVWMPVVQAEGDSNGAEVYKLNCAACHGANLEGGIAPALRDSPVIMDGQEAQIIELIYNGRPRNGMPGWKNQLSEQQIQDVVAYLKNPEDTVAQNPGVVEVLEPEINTDDIFPRLKRNFLFVYLWTIIAMTALLVWVRRRS